jgi:SAM-dependent methyltransferase
MNLYEAYWNHKYISKETGWDIGCVSKPLKNYIDQLKDKSIKILIPGGGNSYEAEYLHSRGFENVFVVDISKVPLQNLQNRVPDFPKDHLLHFDFFDIEDSFDLILEQTFFCAINPSLRLKYASTSNRLLTEKGKLTGVLFDAPLNTESPPFGGNKTEYLEIFEPYFNIEIMERSHNSISERSGRELFIKMHKK